MQELAVLPDPDEANPETIELLTKIEGDLALLRKKIDDAS
jgi:hypothetical protein